MKKVCALLSFLGIAVSLAGAQTSAVEQAFRNSLRKQQLVLRNYSNDQLVHASCTGGTLIFDKPHWHMLGVTEVNSVKVKRGQVIIEGDRKALERDKTGKLELYQVSKSVQIVIDVPIAEMDSALPALKAQLFFPTLESAITNVPKKLQSGIPPATKADKKALPLPKCDCAAEGTDACKDHAADEGLVAPKLLKSVDLNFSNEARNAHASGLVETGIYLNELGEIVDLWIVKPAGLGMDEQAARAVMQYKFKPASCHLKPVATALFIEFNFESK